MSHMQGMLTTLNMWTHTGDQTKDSTSLETMPAYLIYLLASRLGSSHKNDGQMHAHHLIFLPPTQTLVWECLLLCLALSSRPNGAVTVIHKLDASLHTTSGYFLHLPVKPQPKLHRTTEHYTSKN